MDCKHVQRQLSSALDAHPSIQQHLGDCRECRNFANDLLNIQAMIDTGVKTPVLLKEATLDRCRTILADQAGKQPWTARQRWIQLIDSPRFVALTAALSVLLLITSVGLQFSGHQSSGTEMLVKVSVIQIILQNLIAALFMPALLMFRHRLGGAMIPTAQSGE